MRRSPIGVAMMLGLLTLSSLWPQPGVTNVAAGTSDLANQVAQLQIELAIVRQYSGQFLSTVYWALGVVAALAVLLVGFGWFSNFRLFEREKLSMRLDLESGLASQAREAIQQLERRFESLRKLLTDSTTEDIGRSEARIMDSEKSQARSLGTQVERLGNSMKSVQYDIDEMEHNRWMAEKVYPNAIRKAVEMVALGVSLQSDFRISRALDFVLAGLRMLNQEKRTRLDAKDTSDLQKTLDSIHEGYSLVIDSIRGQIAAMKP